MKASPTPLAIMLAAWLVFLVLVVRAIWRSDDPAKAKIYTGAKFWGIFVSAIIGPSLTNIKCRFPGFQASRLPGFQASRLPGWASALIWAVYSLPFTLSGGYVVSRIIHSVTGSDSGPMRRD